MNNLNYNLKNIENVFIRPSIEFKWSEFIIFGIVLASSLAIGIFYGFFGSKNKTNEEFLMAGRSMGIIPVTFSLICTFISAITILGNPVEIYFYGTQYAFFIFSFPLMTLIMSYIYAPVYTSLKLTSAYEYLEWRFSKIVRMLSSTFALLYLIVYMPTTVYGPSLALDQVAGINKYISCATIFIVCIIYSSLGGLKAVLWTDALQGVVMIVSLLAIVIAGTIEMGGVNKIWTRSQDTNRIEFFNFDTDLRTRYTVWTTVFGELLFWLPIFGATQAQIQRYNSLPSLRKVRIALFYNMIGLIVIVVLSCWNGLLVYAKYFDCDPVGAKIVSSPDQLLPLFVMEVLAKYPGIPGILLGGITCGSLSSISSALNSMTATITEDFVKYYYPKLSETKLARVSKITSVVCGTVAFSFVFVIGAVNDTIQISPFTVLFGGIFLGPIFGAFTLGIFFPWANEKGTLCGMLLTIIIACVPGLGGILASRTDGKLPDQKLFLTTENCERENFSPDPNFNFSHNFDWTNNWKNEVYSWDDQIYSLAYEWLPGVGIIGTILFGLLFSLILNIFTKSKNSELVKEKLFSKILLRMWEKLLGRKYLTNWVEFTNEN